MENLREKEKKILEMGQWNERMEWNCRAEKWVEMEKKEGTYNQKVAEKCFPSQLPQVAFLFLKMVLASSSPQMHLSPHFLSQKVENAPLWALMKVSAVLAAQGATESTFLFHPNESFLLGSLVYIAFSGYLSLNCPFLLTCRFPVQVYPVHLTSPRKISELHFNASYLSAFLGEQDYLMSRRAQETSLKIEVQVARI